MNKTERELARKLAERYAERAGFNFQKGNLWVKGYFRKRVQDDLRLIKEVLPALAKEASYVSPGECKQCQDRQRDSERQLLDEVKDWREQARWRKVE